MNIKYFIILLLIPMTMIDIGHALKKKLNIYVSCRSYFICLNNKIDI